MMKDSTTTDTTLHFLRRYNLNLLPILRDILRTQSVARTAENVGLSQSAVSAALSRMRETFDDDLLVMHGRRLELTQKGRLLIEKCERACQEVEALLRPETFDPLSITRRFVICAADYITLMLAPSVARMMESRAPMATLHFVEYSKDQATELLYGEIDALLLPTSSGSHLLANNDCVSLFTDEIVVIASARNPPFRGRLTRATYEAARHVMFNRSSNMYASHEARILLKLAIQQRNVVMVENFLTLPAIVEATDCLALVQRRLAHRLQQSYQIAIHPAPFETEPLEIAAYWSMATRHAPINIWFRSLLMEAGAELQNTADAG